MIPTTIVRNLLIASLALLSLSAVGAVPQSADGQDIPSLAPMVEKATPAVVNIATEGHVELRSNPLFNDPFFRRFFNFREQPRHRRTQSLGSGVIVDARRGLIMTNNHVIANADQITVKLRDGRVFKAELVGTDPDTDVAVVKIPADKLTALPLADSEKLRVGDFVVAIGNPFGLGQTVTSGIVSALARSGLGITGYEDLIQTDASINPGNSGGALVNLRGELVGINTAIYSQTGSNIGIGFAIPVNMASQIMEQLVEHGEVQRGFLGAQLQDLDGELAEAFGLPITEGAVLVNIVRGSPAEEAGLKPGDVVTHINGRRVTSAADLRNQVGITRVGVKIDLTYLRDAESRQVSIIVAEREEVSATGPQFGNKRLAGTTFGEIPEDSPAYGRVTGVMAFAIERDSPAWAGGLREGDIVTSVNRQPIVSVPIFLQVVNQIKGQLLLRVLRGRQAAFIIIE
ncbi:MAG: DegQ family serine endoprotease [Gammaproteobacteria bacterium]|nr:DegQ family serine endoprotease [Gammaproteobacteria bacterium]